ncbi:MAG: ankyrin repeat domain-containing protein [Tatlockia sp.]|nr:ankyrin repeat domain-containing protein [Tatlockia sp.]
MKKPFEAYPNTFFLTVNPDPLQFLAQHCEKFSEINLNKKRYSKKEIEDFYHKEKGIIDSLNSLIKRLKNAEKGSQARYEAAIEMYKAFGFKVGDQNIQETYQRLDTESGISGDSRIYHLWRHIAEMGSLTIINILEQIGQKLNHQDIMNTQNFGFFPAFYASLEGNFKTYYKLSQGYIGIVKGSFSLGFEFNASDMHNILVLHPQKMKEYMNLPKNWFMPDIFNHIGIFDTWDEIAQSLKESDLNWHEHETNFVPPECEDDFYIKSLKDHIEQSEDDLEWSPVHWAICLGNYDLLISMMKNHINIHQSIPSSDHWGLDLASLAGHVKIVALFLKLLPLLDPLFSKERLNRAIIFACYAGQADCLELLLNYAKDTYELLIPFKDNNDVPALHIACKEGWTDCVNLLVLHQLIDNYQEDKFSTFEYAVIKGYVSVVDLLLEKSLLSNDNDSQTSLIKDALALAKEHGQSEVYQLLDLYSQADNLPKNNGYKR